MRRPKPRLYLRGRVYWTWVQAPDQAPRYVSTGCRDKKAAELRAAELERIAASPADHAAHQVTLAQAIERLLAARRRDARAEGTVSMYLTKGRHLLRVFAELVGPDPLLAACATARHVDSYIDQRLAEGAARTTIHKFGKLLPSRAP